MTKSRERRSDAAIDPERLALLLEGRLPPTEREALMARLSESPDDLAVYADATVAARDIEIPLRARRSRWHRHPASWLAIAASIAAIIVIPLYLLQARTEGRDVVARHVALLGDGSGIPAGFELSPWSTTRSGTESVPTGALPWRIGARLVDLEVAAAVSDTASVARLGHELALLLEAAAVPAPTRSVYLDRAAIARGPDDDWLAESALARQRITRQLADERLELGAWVEAARFAAARQRAEFFRTKESAAAVARLREIGAPEPAVVDLIAAASGSQSMTEERWEELAAGLRELLASR